jgi:hypothetical protein
MRMDHANSTRRTGRRTSLFHDRFVFIEFSIPPTLLMVKFHNRWKVLITHGFILFI